MHQIQHVPHRLWGSRSVERYVRLFYGDPGVEATTWQHLVGDSTRSRIPVSHQRDPPTHTHAPVSEDVYLSVPCPCVSWYKSNCVGEDQQHRTKSRYRRYCYVKRSVRVNAPRFSRPTAQQVGAVGGNPEREVLSGWGKIVARQGTRKDPRMAGWLSFVLVAIISAIAMAGSRVVSAAPSKCWKWYILFFIIYFIVIFVGISVKFWKMRYSFFDCRVSKINLSDPHACYLRDV